MIGIYFESALGQNKQPIYMKIPQECLVGRERLVYKILKNLYGLKQVRRLWNKTIIRFFQRIGFISTNTDVYIFIIKCKGELIIVNMYLYHLILRSKSQKALVWLKDHLIKEFSMKDLEEAKTIIRWEITYKEGNLKIDQ